jgi:glycosyltransferase involved in cell wall biosynthesis
VEEKVLNWPLINHSPTPIILKDFSEIGSIDTSKDGILALTDGWRPGAAAAILRGGINAQTALEVMAQSGIRDLKIFHIEEKIPHLEDVFISTVVNPAHTMFENVNIVWRRESSVYELIRQIGEEYSMLYVGAPLAHSEILPFYNKIKEVYQGSITMVRGPMQDIEFDEGDEIFRWVRERTYEANDFALSAVLRNCKKKLGLKIAVVLPSLNEERTVGNVIETALEVKDAGVIDEVLLIDSDSVDKTREIAHSYGIPVYKHPEVASHLGTYRGKGEAMFKSAFISDADIMAWVDTDIESIRPRFFYGLLGPMLAYPQIKFSKGYFSRPVRVEASGLELGGGRVTEILARPWINTYRPELSGYIQPLAGTVAIHKDLFRQMSIPVNYGVEIAMLIQAVQLGGLWSTCQVNLGEVIHKSKDVIGLSEMSFQILQVLAQMEHGGKVRQSNDVLRRVFSAHGNFEIGLKRFHTQWRSFLDEKNG